MGLKPLIIIGIAGETGSGKTTISEAIIDAIGKEQVAYIQHDSYYKDRSNISLKERKTLIMIILML